MNKQLVNIIIFSSLALIMLGGCIYSWPDLRPWGIFVALAVIAALNLLTYFLHRAWNKAMIIASGLIAVGIFAFFGSSSFLPDIRPMIVSGLLAAFGIIVFIFGFKTSKDGGGATSLKSNIFLIAYWIVAILLLGISAVLLPMINWSHPKDPAAVMILSFIMAMFMIYTAARKHSAQKQVFWTGVIFVVNFLLVKLYEAGTLNFIGKFYRLFEPAYESFDYLAVKFEWGLIIATLILAIIVIIKKYKVNELQNRSLYYFILLPIMAIFLFEMFGLPAGFLAGTTTRSDLLVTDANAVLSTFGMVFVGAVAYVLFILFPFWVAMLYAGIWWIFWKMWLLHHPDPKLFTDLQSFLPAAVFLFFTGVKRITLPMILLLFGLRRKKI